MHKIQNNIYACETDRMTKVCTSVSLCLCYLGSQQSGQVDFRNHLAASVAFSLVTVLMILHQVPQFSS